MRSIMRIICFKNFIQIFIMFLALLGALWLPIAAFPQNNEDTKTSEKTSSERKEYRIYLFPFQEVEGAGEIKKATIRHINDKFEERLINSLRFTINPHLDLPKLAQIDVLDARTIVTHLKERWDDERIDPAQYVIVGIVKVVKQTNVEIRIGITVKLIDVYTQSYVGAKSATAAMESLQNLEDVEQPAKDLADQISKLIPLYGIVTSINDTYHKGMLATEVGINFGRKRGVEKGMKFEVITEVVIKGPDAKPIVLPPEIRCTIEITEVSDEAAKGIVKKPLELLRIEPFKDKVREVRFPPPSTPTFMPIKPPGPIKRFGGWTWRHKYLVGGTAVVVGGIVWVVTRPPEEGEVVITFTF